MPRRALAVTTINASDNRCLRALDAESLNSGVSFFIAGDTKTPPDFALPGATYLSIETQEKQFPALGKLLPKKHYTRKNIAYLAAMQEGAEEIQETDDDNFPRASFWQVTTTAPLSVNTVDQKPWANVYALFTSRRIWPRGFPLEYVHCPKPVVGSARTLPVPLILQGLADENSDVDAIYRMTCDLPVTFEKRSPLMISPGSWCPFNSQNTLFHRAVFQLLYLPSFCSFRMTDIWRSFVAQRCLWELGQGIVFHEATVHQERNDHNLLRDFEDEIPGYLLNEKIRLTLEDCRLDPQDTARNLIICYEALISRGFIAAGELALVRTWRAEVERLIR